jgi:hypothetical protein
MTAKRASLAILTHPVDHFSRGHYLVQLMIPEWERMGFRIVVVDDASTFVPADAALLHVDLTVVPDPYRRLAERYPFVLNGRVLDIRKRRFSRQLLDRRDIYSGSVIVKTDCNYGGWPELRRSILESPIGSIARRFGREDEACRELAALAQRLPWRWKRMFPVGTYPLYRTCDLVPRGVWGNPNLVVERFMAERAGDNYCCRHWVFFGCQEVNKRTMSPHYVVKGGSIIERIADPVPEELRAIREELGFDYGKFDYGIVDGQVVLYDVNRTPGATADPRNHADTVALLSQGLHAALQRNL